MKYLFYVIICCSPLYSALPPAPVVSPSSSGSSGKSVEVVPAAIARSPRKELGTIVTQRKAFFDSHKQKVLGVNQGTVVRRDSAISEEIVLESAIIKVKGIRRGSALAVVAENYIKATQEKNPLKTQDS